MNKLEKHLQDIKDAVDIMRKMHSIDAAAHKTLTEALDEALQIHNVSGQVCGFYMAGMDTIGRCNNCGKMPHEHT